MPGVVCAIRGGPASQETVNIALKLAREKALPLTFLYVVNIDFLSRTASSRVQLIIEELHQMGDFILLHAQESAQAQGIPASGVIRRGEVGEEIINLCQEIQADIVVLGRPQGQAGADVFDHQKLDVFSKMIESTSGARVMIVDGTGDE